MRIAIVGAGGGVGSSVAFNLLLQPQPFDVLLADGRSRMITSHEMDLQQVLAAGATGTVRSVTLAQIHAADVVIVCAAAPLTVNRSRLVYLRDNAEIINNVAAALGEPGAWPGILLVVTNPVDVLSTLLVSEGFDRRRVIGYTANDSLRLRTAVGEQLGVPASTVDAWVLGEHGDGFVPLLDRISVGGERVTLDAAQRHAAQEFVRSWYVRHVALDSGRSSTWTTGHGVARMIAALRDDGDDAEPWPAAVVLDGEYGIRDAAVTVPVTLDPGGVAGILEWDLAPAELTALRRAARNVRGAAETIASSRAARGRRPGT